MILSNFVKRSIKRTPAERNTAALKRLFFKIDETAGNAFTRQSISAFSTSLLSKIAKDVKKPKVLFLTNSHNGMSQRAKTMLEDNGFTVNIELALSRKQMIKSVDILKPDIIICPFLTAKVPGEIWQNPDVPCIIVHPGVQGDRGMSSIEWAMYGKNAFGLTCLSAVEEMDAGPVWATRVVEPSSDREEIPCSLTKSSIYKHEITDAAMDAISETILKFMNNVDPVEVEENDPKTLGSLRDTMPPEEREINFNAHSAEEISKKIRMSDGQPGAKITLNNGESFFAFDAHVDSTGAHLTSTVIDIDNYKPGEIIAKRNKAVAILCKDKGLIWVGHAKKDKKGIKLPATICLEENVANIPEVTLPSTDFALNSTDNLWKKPVDTYMDIWTSTVDGVCYVFFDVYNGAMDTETCIRIKKCIDDVARRSDVDAIVLAGGYNSFSNGIHLNMIERLRNEGNCEQESWNNINAINDIVQSTFNIKDKVTISAIRGGAGAGGVMMALAADAVWTHSNIVLNPHYLSMGLNGSEYWTYFLPKRVGSEMASKLTLDKQAISAERSAAIGMIDEVFGGNVNEFQEQLHGKVMQYMSENQQSIIKKKQENMTKEEIEKIEQHRHEELVIMKHNFKSKEYKDARKGFVMKEKSLATPTHLTERRGQVMSGKKFSKKLLKKLEKKISTFDGRKPKISILLVGDRPDSKVYVDSKIAEAKQIGIETELFWYKGPKQGSDLQVELVDKIQELNHDESVDGIMLEVPTLLGVDANTLIPEIELDKDVDCLNPINFHGCLTANESHNEATFIPPCPAGILELILGYGGNLKGQNAVVIGSSLNLGWPVACLLEREGCQVTVVNVNGSSNIADHTATADIIVSAVGKANLITDEMVKPGAIVVDAGISVDEEGKMVGDVSEVAKKEVSGMYSPVPNGVGPMTVAKMMENVVKSYEMRQCQRDVVVKKKKQSDSMMNMPLE